MPYICLLQEFNSDGISASGWYKICKTERDVQTLEREYQTKTRFPIKIIHSVQVADAQSVKANLHQRLVKYRRSRSGSGSDEWFFFENVDIQDVAALINEYRQTPAYSPSSFYREHSHSPYTYGHDWFDNLPVIGVVLVLIIGFGVASSGSLSMGVSTQVVVPQSPGIVNQAHLRSAPQIGNEFIIGYLRSGEQVTAYEVSSDGQWRRVRLADGSSGWVANNLIR